MKATQKQLILRSLLCLIVPGVILPAALLGQNTGQPAVVAAAPEQLLQDADQALQKQDYVSAAQALEAYIAERPEDYRAEFNLAYAYSLSGRRAEAITHYKSVLSRQPELTPAHLNLGLLLLQDAHPEEAVEHLRAVVQQQPENDTANLNLAEALAALKRLPEAGEAYERVLKLKPDDARAHLAYGKLLQESNPASAEEHLRRAFQIDPALEEARFRLAELLEARSAGSADHAAGDEAAEIYRQILEKHPERGDLRTRLGEIYLSGKKYSAAAEQLEAARAAGDSSLALAKELLQAYLNAGQTVEVRSQGPVARSQNLESESRAEPEPPRDAASVGAAGGNISARRPENRERLQDYLSGKQTSARDEAVKNELERNREKALALTREILLQEGRNPEMRLVYGRLLMEKRDYRAAAQEFGQAAALQPQSVEAFRNWASALYLSGEYEATVGALGKISELKQDTAGTYFLRAISLDKLHIRKPALENYQKFLAIDAGKNPDQEFQARQRSKLLAREIEKGITGGK